MKIARFLAGSGLAVSLVSAVAGQVRITEFMYDGPSGEFIEFTNVGAAPADVTGWSFDDSNHPGGTPSYYDLSSFSPIQPGESVILTELLAADFRANWGLPASVRILGELGTLAGHNLGRNDTMNLLDGSLATVDRLRFGDQDFPGSIRPRFRSANPNSFAALGADDIFQWSLASVGDAQGSYTTALNDTGNPGSYVPEPAGLTLLGLGGAALLRRRRN